MLCWCVCQYASMLYSIIIRPPDRLTRRALRTRPLSIQDMKILTYELKERRFNDSSVAHRMNASIAAYVTPKVST